VSAIVPLAGGLEAIVDEDDLEMLSGFKWKPLRLSHDTYAVSSFVTNGRHHTIYMHRMVMLPDPALDVDHVNMDGLDNRKDNLRACTRSENLHNSALRKNSTTGYKGVSPIARRPGYWQVGLRIGEERVFVGEFDNPIKAAVAFDAVARERLGEFARLNFPREGEHAARQPV
jgi:hypothetical protein